MSLQTTIISPTCEAWLTINLNRKSKIYTLRDVYIWCINYLNLKRNSVSFLQIRTTFGILPAETFQLNIVSWQLIHRINDTTLLCFISVRRLRNNIRILQIDKLYSVCFHLIVICPHWPCAVITFPILTNISNNKVIKGCTTIVSTNCTCGHFCCREVVFDIR